MTTLRVHFDGRVFVPEGPVDLPHGQSFEIKLPELKKLKRLPIAIDAETGLPHFVVPPGSRPIKPEDVRRAMDDE